MNQKELFPLFPPVCYLEDRVLLIPPSMFKRLEGCTINDCRIFILVTEGTLTMQVNGKQQELKACTIYDTMDGINTRILQVGPDLKAYCLVPNRQFAGEALKNLKPGPPHLFLGQQFFSILPLSREETGVLERQMILMKDALSRLDHYYRQDLVVGYFKSFNLEHGNILFDRFKGEEQSDMTLSKQDMIMMDFVRLVFKHFKEEHRIEFFADKLCISSKHLSRVVKDMTGRTPHEFIRDEILHYAMTALEDENVSVQQIAEMLHFSDQAAFCKFFKKQMNLSPMAYRKRMSVS